MTRPEMARHDQQTERISKMTRTRLIALALAGLLPVLSACGPLVGAGAVVAADKVVEEKEGGDGLF